MFLSFSVTFMIPSKLASAILIKFAKPWSRFGFRFLPGGFVVAYMFLGMSPSDSINPV